MSRNQKIIIGIVTLVFVIGVVSALNFLSRQGTQMSARNNQVQTPAAQTGVPVLSTVSEKTADGSVAGAPVPAPQSEVPQQGASEQATVTNKADAEKMLQDTESDFQSIDSDVSAQ